PPQLINPTRNVSLLSAQSLPGKIAGAASTPPITAEVLRKSRREVSSFLVVFINSLTGFTKPYADAMPTSRKADDASRVHLHSIGDRSRTQSLSSTPGRV